MTCGNLKSRAFQILLRIFLAIHPVCSWYLFVVPVLPFSPEMCCHVSWKLGCLLWDAQRVLSVTLSLPTGGKDRCSLGPSWGWRCPWRRWLGCSMQMEITSPKAGEGPRVLNVALWVAQVIPAVDYQGLSHVFVLHSSKYNEPMPVEDVALYPQLSWVLLSF